MTYRTFLRAARTFEEFASAEKRTVDTDLTYAEAREQCQQYNDDLSEAQQAIGEKMEFEQE